MGKSRRTVVQKPKQYTRLGESKVKRGVETGTYVGGHDAQVRSPVTDDE